MLLFIGWLVTWTTVLSLVMLEARRLSGSAVKKSTTDIWGAGFVAALIPVYSVWIATHLGTEGSEDTQPYSLATRPPSPVRVLRMRFLRAIFWTYPVIVLGLVMFFAFRVEREPPSQAVSVNPVQTSLPAKTRGATPFELAEPSLGRLNFFPDGLTLIKLNRVLGSEGKKLDFVVYPCDGSHGTDLGMTAIVCTGNTVSYSWYNTSVVASFFEPTFKPASSEIYSLAVRMPGPDVYDTPDDVPKAYKNLCILGACLGLDKEDEHPRGFWKDCVTDTGRKEGPCPSKWRGMARGGPIKSQTHVVEGHLLYYGGFTSWLMVFNERDYASLPGRTF
jgi:hypothetical protein